MAVLRYGWQSFFACLRVNDISSLFFEDDIRLFGFIRFTTGDAMSKRVKFALITWIGESVSGLQRAKTGTDKTLVKEVVQVTSYLSNPN